MQYHKPPFLSSSLDKVVSLAKALAICTPPRSLMSSGTASSPSLELPRIVAPPLRPEIPLALAANRQHLPPLSHPRPDSTYIGRVRNRANDGRNHKHEHNVDTDGLGRPPEVLVSVGLHVCATPVLAHRPSVFNPFPRPRFQCCRASVVHRARVRFFARWEGERTG